MKKSILIVTNKMVMGGIEKSLLSMINSIDNTQYDITVFLTEEGGELRGDLPKWVNVKVIPNLNASILSRVKNALQRMSILEAINILYYSILTKMTSKSYKGYYYYNKINNRIKKEYDLAIAYHMPISFATTYIIDNIKAKNKIAYIHFDMDKYYNMEFGEIILKKYKKYFQKYDKIFCVSSEAKNKFSKYYPGLIEKTDIFYNILDKKSIELKSLEKCNIKSKENELKIVTVARLASEKGQLIIPSVIKKLIDNGIGVKWYCIGEGEERVNIEKRIKELNIEDNLILLGMQKNPYSFIRNCDIYVQTSIYEGFCITLAEARILNKPIITTNFVGVNDQIINDRNGIIVNYDENEIYNAILRLFKNKELQAKFINNLKKNSNDYSEGIKKIYELVN